MEPEIIVAIMLGFMILMIMAGMPIAFAIGIAGGIGVVLLRGWGTLLYSLGSLPVSRIASYSLAALPLYILMGNFIAISGVGTDAYDMAYKWFGKIRGGLVVATVVASGMIAATTGSAITSVAILAKIAIPEMERLGYDRAMSVGAVASCGPLGTLIPPSMAFIIVGVLAELSIAKLFIAGILPGILSVILFSTMIFTRCFFNPKLAPTGVSFSWKERFLSLRKAWGILLIFVIVIGGLYTGMATILETAALGCLVALTMVVLNIFNKRCTWRDLWGAVMDSIVISSMIFAFFICAGVLGLFVTISDIVAGAVNIVEVLDVPPMAVVVAFLFILLIMGCFLDTTSVIMISVPLFFPILVGGLNVDPIWFSVITVIMVEVAALTPPIGMALFYMKGIYPDATLEEIIRGSSWFVAMNLLVVILLLIFPKIATFLLDTMW